MSDRHDNAEDQATGAVPPGLDELDAHLLEVGARWRAASPEIGAVAGRLHERAAQLTAEQATFHTSVASAESAAPRLRTVSAPTALHGDGGARRRPLRRASRLVAALAAVAVVGALAALLLSASPARPSLQSHGPDTTASLPIKHGEWTTLDKLNANVELDANDLPAIAPSDPRVVYESMVYGIQQHRAGSLRRTDDGGATWHDLPLPIPADHVGHAGMLVSPLDPRTVFLSLISTNGADCPADRVQPMTESTLPGAVLCWLQYTSTDGGAHWVTTALPMPSTLTPSLFTTSVAANSLNGHTYLYALLNCLGAQNCSRLGASADGGLTWRYADAPLVASGAGSVCEFTSDMHGTALFAVTTPTTCYVGEQKPLTLWRSDDAGAHWSDLGVLATPNVRGAVIFYERGTDRTLMYMAQPRTVAMATDKMGGQHPTFSADIADLKVSQDGGVTWDPAPAAGIPAGLKPYYDIGPMGTLSDGSVVVDFVAQGRQENFGGSTLFAWKPGDAAWRQLAPPLTWEADALLAVAGARPGADTLFLTMADRGGGSASHPTFSFLRYDP